MDSVEYSELLVKFGKGLMRIAEGAEAAADGDLEGAQKEEAIVKAKAKYVEYLEIREKIKAKAGEGLLLAEYDGAHKFHLELLKESLEKLKAI